MASIGELVVELRATVDKFNADMKSAQRETTAFEKNYKPTLDLLKQGATIAGAAGAAIVGALVAATKTAANYGDSIRDASIRTGLAAETISGLKYAAEQSGASFEDLTNGLKFFEKNLYQAALTGKGTAAEAFHALGISVDQVRAAGGKVEPMLKLVADRFSQLGPVADRSAIAMQLFGKNGTQLIEFLSLGSDGLEAMTKKAELFGLVVGKDAVDAADAFNDSLNDLKQSVLGLTLAIGNELLGKGGNLIDLMTAWVVTGKDLVSGTVKNENATSRWVEVLKDLTTAIPGVGLIYFKDALDQTGKAAAKNYVELAILGDTEKKVAADVRYLTQTLAEQAEAEKLHAKFIKEKSELIAKHAKDTEAAYDKIRRAGYDLHKDQLDLWEDERRTAQQTANAQAQVFLDRAELIERATKRASEMAADAEAEMRANSERSLEYGEYIYKRSLDDRRDTLKSNLEQVKELEDKAAKDRKAAFDDIRQSAGAIFDDMLRNGESVFSSLGNALKGGALSLGRSIFQDITAHLFGPVKQAFDQFFEGLIGSTVGKLGQKLGAALSGAIGLGGAAGAGAAGGTGGVTAGGSFGLGMGGTGGGLGGALAAVGGIPGVGVLAAGIGMAISSIGGGREAADAFTKQIQNKFNEAYAKAQTDEELQYAWDWFRQQAADFQGGGTVSSSGAWKNPLFFGGKVSDQANVVWQAMQQLEPLVNARLADLPSAAPVTVTNIFNGPVDVSMKDWLAETLRQIVEENTGGTVTMLSKEIGYAT